MRKDGYNIICETIMLIERVDENRFKRLWNRTWIGKRSNLRKLVQRLKIWKLPREIYGEIYNAIKRLAQIGTRKNEEVANDIRQITMRVGDGEFKSGKELNAEINAILKKHGLKSLPLYEQKQI